MMSTTSLRSFVMGTGAISFYEMGTGGSWIYFPMGTAQLLEVVGTRFHLGTGDGT